MAKTSLNVSEVRELLASATWSPGGTGGTTQFVAAAFPEDVANSVIEVLGEHGCSLGPCLGAKAPLDYEIGASRVDVSDRFKEGRLVNVASPDLDSFLKDPGDSV